jgi:uncharacterized membrane protein YozB (DUF420 family)
VLTGPNVILALKIAVAAVTPILIAALIAIALGKQRLHGRLNIAFFVLTLAAVLGLELIIRFVDPNLFDYFTETDRRMMTWHLSFSIPSAILLPLMLLSGLTHRRQLHILLGSLFLVCWAGTFVTGIFFLPNGPR